MTENQQGGDTLVLPSRQPQAQRVASKTLYVANQRNDFQFTVDGKTVDGYAELGNIRLRRVAVRAQTRTDAQGKPVTDLVATMNLVLDDETIGAVINGTDQAHALYRNPRYAGWNNREERPHRINAQQWIRLEARDKPLALVNHLATEHGWRIIKNPPNQNDDRKTSDLYVCRPQTDPDADPKVSGVSVDAIEIFVNPKYEEGFKSFPQGLEEIRKRWESIVAMENPAVKAKALEQFAATAHFLGGIYYSERDSRWWARTTDVGMLTIDGTEFRLYEPRDVESLDDDVYASVLAQAATNGAVGAEPDAGELALPSLDGSGF